MESLPHQCSSVIQGCAHDSITVILLPNHCKSFAEEHPDLLSMTTAWVEMLTANQLTE